MQEWKVIPNAHQIIYHLESGSDEKNLKHIIETCAEKSISLLKDSIQDTSLYLLFEWEPHQYCLSVSVTDATKTADSPIIVKVNFSQLKEQLAKLPAPEKLSKDNDLADSIQFLLHDYLTTCTAFFKYSLVAIFHKSTRENTMLL